MRPSLLLFAVAGVMFLGGCGPSDDAADSASTPEAADANASNASATANATVGGAVSIPELCRALDSARSGDTAGLDRFAAPAVLAELATSSTPLTERDGTCVTEAGDAEITLVVEDRGADGFYATDVLSQIVGDNALLADSNSRTVEEVCSELGAIFRMGDGMAWRELDVYATMEVLRELRGVEDATASITAEGNTCVVASENFGDADLILTVGQGAEGLMATSAEYKATGEAANY